MRHLVVCCDGTWNTADENEHGVPTPTNVRLFHNALAETDAHGHPQVRRYLSGVGADGSAITRAIDGGIGRGLSANIMNAYLWLAATYRPGDRIVLVGFSRGAFTARSLAGMLGCCGLVARPTWETVKRVYERGYADHDDGWAEGLAFHDGFGPDARPERGSRIELVAVWDTVGALGVPDSLALLDLLDDPRRHAFHDTHLADEVGYARHALALDECRGAFVPTLWTDAVTHAPLENDGRVEQRWFPGSHCDVGGGYVETALSDGALRWMIDEATATVGLAFRPELLSQLDADPLGLLHDSAVGMWDRLSTAPRAVPHVGDDAAVDASAVTRARTGTLRQEPYREGTRLRPGEQHQVEVIARHPWCPTGLWLDAGTYRATATGEWVDRDVPAGPDGVVDRPWSTALIETAADLWGRVETWFRRTHPSAEFLGTKRWEPARWMELVGVVANGAGRDDERGADGHQYVVLGATADVHVQRAGYLYAFANDAWGMYANNRGSVLLTVERR